MYALNLAENGRILSATYPQYAPQGAVMVEKLPEGNLADYLYKDGQFVNDPLNWCNPNTERINKLKAKLRETDYHIIKIAEGAATLLECAEIIKQRAMWRKEINALEQEE